MDTIARAPGAIGSFCAAADDSSAKKKNDLACRRDRET